MLDYTQQKGTLTELHCIMDLTNLGIRCLKPVDESSKYDIVADLDGTFIRIQCKTATQLSEGVYTISCRSCKTRASGNSRRSYTEDEIDFFGTYINGKCYLIPINEASSHNKTLRFVPTVNGQAVTYAFDYELEKQINKLE